MILDDGGLGLHEKIVKAFKEKGWAELTPIQLKAIPYILRGDNVLIIAPTGMGKTEAAMLPVLSMMLSQNVEPVSVLYITPMKALINDLYQRIKWWTDRLGFRVARKHGDVSSRERMRRLKNVPHILIITPESLEIDLDWAPKFRQHYQNLRWVIVDELHEFASSKRGAQLALQLERLARLAKRDIQRIGISATLGNPEDALTLLSGSSKRRKTIVDEGMKRKAIIKVRSVDEENNVWSELAIKVKDEIEKPSIIFVNSRYMAEKLKQGLEDVGIRDVFVHHSSVSPEDREEAEERLRRGELSAIVATKTLELGIDIGEIAKVLQVKSPGRVINLVQRIGRSGHRLGLPSKGTVIAIGEFDAIESAALASLLYEGYVEPVVIGEIPLDVIARTIQGILLERKSATEKEIYDLIASHPFVRISRNKFKELITYLEMQGVVRRYGAWLRLGSTFYKIWKFRSGKTKAWWSRDFSEFFSLISDRDLFQVKHGDRIVGSLDSVFVYRYLRAGDVIRLGGRAWRVKRIDTGLSRVEVEPSDEPGEIPLWRGESIRRSRKVAEKVLLLVSDGIEVLHPLLLLDKDVIKIIEKWNNKINNIYKNLNKNTIIYEKYRDEHIIIGSFGSALSETLALVLMDVLVRKQGLSTYYRSSFIGFSILNRTNNDIIKILMEIDPYDIENIICKILPRSPLYGQTIREIQLSLGHVGGIRDIEEGLLASEAKRQAINNYLDVTGAIEFLEKLQNNEINIIKSEVLSPLGESIIRLPPVRPWLPDLAGRIVRMLEDYALSVIDLADALEISDKTVENKLKDMRKPEYRDKRTFCFVDILDEECKWALVKDAEKIVSMEDFSSSFKPRFLNEPLRVVIKATSDGSYKEIIVTPSIIIKKWDKIKSDIPEEIYMLKVSPAYGPAVRDLTIVYYHVPRELVKYLILNAATILQSRKTRIYY